MNVNQLLIVFIIKFEAIVVACSLAIQVHLLSIYPKGGTREVNHLKGTTFVWSILICDYSIVVGMVSI